MVAITINTTLKAEVEARLGEAQKLGIHCPATWSAYVNEALTKYNPSWALARAKDLDKKTTIRLRPDAEKALATFEAGTRSRFVDRVVRTWLRRHLIPAINYRLKKRADA